MKNIVVNGTTYVPLVECGPMVERGPIKIVVIERGFIYVGRVEASDGEVTIHDARSLIRWGSSQHLGELVHGPLENTLLGASCTVRVRDGQIIHMIEVDQNDWRKYIID